MLDDNMSVKFSADSVGGKSKSRKKQDQWFLTETGLYRVLFKAQSKIANEFAKWVAREVIPSIRKHGSFRLSAKAEVERQQIEADFKKLLDELKRNLDEKEISYQNLEKNLNENEKQLEEQEAIYQIRIRALLDQNEEKLTQLKEQKDDLQSHVLEDKQRAAYIMAAENPLSASATRMDNPDYRSLVHGAIHAIANELTKGWYKKWGRYACMEEMYGAVVGVLSTTGFNLKNQHLSNPIRLFTLLCGVMKRRLVQLELPFTDYSTQMPIYHLYTYVKNYNVFVADMGWEPLSLQVDIEKRFPAHIVSTFGFTNTDYPAEVVNADLSSLYSEIDV